MIISVIVLHQCQPQAEVHQRKYAGAR